MILLSMIFFSTSPIETPEPAHLSSLFEPSKTLSVFEAEKKIQNIHSRISKGIFYFGAGTVLGTAAVLARVGWTLSQVSPWALNVGNECLLLSHLCSSASSHFFRELFNRSSAEGVLPSQYSWLRNQELLSHIPAFSEDEKKLLTFLKKHWLAKSTGFFPIVADWICPAFGVSLQTNPETSNFYARSPLLKLSEPYKNRVQTWKQSLPHPEDFPLLLTRPADLGDYLPNYFKVFQDELPEITASKLAMEIQSRGTKVVVDLTDVLEREANDKEKWLKAWDAYKAEFSKECKEKNVNLRQILCIHRLTQENIGGIRLLVLPEVSKEQVIEQNKFLLEWISTFGLSANRIELDRWEVASGAQVSKYGQTLLIEQQSKEEFISFLSVFEQTWKSKNAQKTFMVNGTMKVLKGLFAVITEEKWNLVKNSATRSSVAQLSMFQIKEQLKQLLQEGEDALFFTTVSHLEQIHASLCALLEIYDPFTSLDFPQIYQDLLTTIPSDLQPLSSYGIHSAGMTTMAGIFKAVEKTVGRTPKVLYGENTYYECINATMIFSNAIPAFEAKEADWKDVDLLIAQFNPVLKRIDFTVTNYCVENVAESVHKALRAKQGGSLTVALDCTLDFLNSTRVESLLTEFQEEIKKGILNIVCIRSGIKFDLFGMDNYCGAPFIMIHNKDPKWIFFDALLTDQVLQTDRLSLNWFCLAYQNAAYELTRYQKQIVDNTKALLSKVPLSLFNQSNNYRIVPVEHGADPAFIDFKISGRFHQLRGAILASGCLYLKCMEEGHPIFYRLSLGFSHPNFAVLFSENGTTIRLTLGLDPTQVDVLVGCFEMIEALNGSPGQMLLEKLSSNTSLPTLTYSKELASF